MSKEETIEILEKKLTEDSLKGTCSLCGNVVRRDFWTDKIHERHCDECSKHIKEIWEGNSNEKIPKYILLPDDNTLRKDLLGHELKKEIKLINDNYKRYDEQSKTLDMNNTNLEKDMKPFLNSITGTRNKNEFKRRFLVHLQENPKRNKASLGTYLLHEISKEIEVGKVIRDMEKCGVLRIREIQDEEFDHDKIIEEYQKLKLKHPEYDERRLLEEVFSRK